MSEYFVAKTGNDSNEHTGFCILECYPDRNN